MNELKKPRGRPRKMGPSLFPEESGVGKLGSVGSRRLGKRKKVKKKKPQTYVAQGFTAKEVGAKKAELVGISKETQTRFTVKEIVDIIKTCHESNLADFRYMGLVLSFAPKGQVARPDQPKTFFENPRAENPGISSAHFDPRSPRLQGWNQGQTSQINHEIDDLFLSDPMQAEQVMIDSMATENARDEGEIR